MNIDIIKNEIQQLDKNLLKLLLFDKSTKRHIVWATNDYIKYGECFAPECEIMIYQITGLNSILIKPRAIKAKEEQNNRTRDKAEVFTPSWICNAQNNLIDEQWFGRKDVFNITENKNWKSTKEKIVFPTKSRHTWQDYVRAKRMEITCGEAPYLVSRYDTVSGKVIQDVHERIGLLDRKLRIIDENTHSEDDWMLWVEKAYQSIYGFEYQGDNLLLARENLLFTFIDYMHNKFNRQPTVKELKKITNIISWNIWQMDGLTYNAPYSEKEHEEQEVQLTLFDFEDKQDEIIQKESVPCVIKDWTNKCCVEYRTLLKKGMPNK